MKTTGSPRTSSPQAAAVPSVTAPPTAVSQITDVSNDLANAYSETAITGNPGNANQFMAASNVLTQSYMAAFNTTNGGTSWAQTHITPPVGVLPSPLITADPSLTFFTGDSHDYASLISVDSSYNTHLFVEQGDPTTGVFGPANEVQVGTNTEPDKPFLAADPQGVFVAYDSNPSGNPDSQPVLLAGSVTLWQTNTIWDSGGDVGAYPAIVPNGSNPGTIYVTWLDYCGNTPTTVSSACSDTSGRILIAKTTDNGSTFTRLDGTAIDPACTIANFPTCGPSKVADVTTGSGSILPNYGGTCAMGCSPRQIASFPSMDIDRSGGAHKGRIYIVWADGAAAQDGNSTVPSPTRMHIYLSSFDPGVSTTWSTPVQIDTGNVNDAWEPSVAVDPNNGRVAVAWYDRRDDTNNRLYRPYYAQSADGGATWSAQIPLSPNMSDPTIDCNGTGDYMQVIAAGGHARAAWTEVSASKPEVWVANVNETALPATFTSTTTTAALRDQSGTAWTQIPGSARDIGTTPDAYCTLMVIGTDSLAGGGGVYVWTGTRWVGPVAGGSGVRITGDPFGLIEVISNSNGIYELIQDNTGHLVWVALPGSGTDIATGANVSLWIIGTNAVAGGGGVWTFNGSSWSQPYGGGGRRIAVGPDGQPWIVNASHQIFCHSLSGWQQLPGAANDIAVGANGVAWVIGTNPVGGGYGIYRWTGTCAPGGSWAAIPGGGVGISVGTDGLPFVFNSGGAIFERMF